MAEASTQDPAPVATATNGPAPLTRRRQAAGQTGPILGLAVLFAFLFLVGLYESWMIPVPVLLSVPVRECSGAFLGILILPFIARLALRSGWWC